MGGPACGLWIPEGLRERAEIVIAQMVRDIAEAGRDRPHDFATSDTRRIGGHRYGDSIPMYCNWEKRLDEDEFDELQVAEGFGFRPEPGSYAIGTHVKGDDAHRALAEVAAYLAEQLGGVIDFGTVLPEAIELPGWSLELDYLSIGGWARRTALDAEAMRAWSRHPRCWMLK